jgi:hypothetical protein
MTWSLAGKYPRILEDEVVGEEAKRLFKDANDMLDKLSAEKTLNPRGVVGCSRPTAWATTSKSTAMKPAPRAGGEPPSAPANRESGLCQLLPGRFRRAEAER